MYTYYYILQQLFSILINLNVIVSIITPVFNDTSMTQIVLIFWFAAQEIFCIIINFLNSWPAWYFCVNQKSSIYLTSGYIIHVFAFDQFNAYLRKKNILWCYFFFFF